MISTPICDFVRDYAARRPSRMHMPGHKGRPLLGFEPLDITEIDGADDLYAPAGIIAESEANASRLFGAHTLYSTEGASLGVRAMLALAMANAGGERPLILAGRNVHRSFLYAAAALDMDVAWLHPRPEDSYHACTLSPADVETALRAAPRQPAAVYLTSPDYLGHTADIAGIAAACHARNVPLLVDNAHGAYLKFLTPSRHPIDLGADLCCDSAHKTLPAVTGAAYLHVSPAAPAPFAKRAREAMALFGSTSPSWLILQSLDLCNRSLEEYPRRLAALIPKLDALKASLVGRGYALRGDEPLKLTVDARAYGHTGDALAARLAAANVVCEFHDPDFLTLMLTPENEDGDLRRLEAALTAVPRLDPLPSSTPPYRAPERAMSLRTACFAPRETLPAEQCLGRVLASTSMSCPPAVPMLMPGERVDEAALARFRYYGVAVCDVVAEGHAKRPPV